jgi:hypothetical protein
MKDQLTQTQSSKPARSWVRDYPPLVALLVALMIAVIVLPSALNLPQANPSQVLEYAPVPPEDDTTPPSAEGSISQLGLGSSSSLTLGVDQASTTPLKPGTGQKPVVKKCVGNPPRQSEDPNAPPCVPFFDGDNGGATWQGVTRDEVTVVLYHSSFTSDHNETEGGDSSAGETTPNIANICDLNKPSAGQTGCNDANDTSKELSVITAARAYARYFNERYQTYNRNVHIYVNWSNAGTPSARRGDAARIWDRFKPFAVMDRSVFSGYGDVFQAAAAKREISTFGSFGFLDNAFYRRAAPKVWSFWPDVEHWADQYVDYVCTQVVPFKTTFAGDDKQSEKMNTKARRLALMYSEDHSYPGLQYFAKLVESGVKGCGGNIVEKVSFPFAGANIDNRCASESETPNCEYGITNVAKMQNADVTTVLWAGGMESRTTAAADQTGWYPEWVVAGDRLLDDLLNARAQDPDVWRHAWVMSNQTKESRFEESPARQAFREAAPGARQVAEYWATTLYREYFGLFKAIHVAGPYLSPETVDQGQHAIPRTSSSDPRVAACYYDPGDYSCVKDAHEAWWDPDAQDPNNEPGVRGCWRMVEGGRRFVPGTWPGSQRVFANRSDPCNGIKGASHNYPA